jgi:hypothetical protein
MRANLDTRWATDELTAARGMARGHGLADPPVAGNHGTKPL